MNCNKMNHFYLYDITFEMSNNSYYFFEANCGQETLKEEEGEQRGSQ